MNHYLDPSEVVIMRINRIVANVAQATSMKSSYGAGTLNGFKHSSSNEKVSPLQAAAIGIKTVTWRIESNDNAHMRPDLVSMRYCWSTFKFPNTNTYLAFAGKLVMLAGRSLAIAGDIIRNIAKIIPPAISSMTHSFTSTSLTSTPRRTEPKRDQTSVVKWFMNKVVQLTRWGSNSQSSQVVQFTCQIPSPRRTSPKFQPRESQCEIIRLARVATTALVGLSRTAASIPISVAHDGKAGLEQKMTQSHWKATRFSRTASNMIWENRVSIVYHPFLSRSIGLAA